MLMEIIYIFPFAAFKFTIEPSDVVVPEGNSVLLPCEGIIQNQAKKGGKTAPNIRWRGPDGQDIGIVGDTFRYVIKIYYKNEK